MAKNVAKDKSNGYEQVAETFISRRNTSIGVSAIRSWSRTLPRGSSVLDLGCGHGVPISQTLIDEGFAVYAVDASAKMIAAFRRRFPSAYVECAAVQDSYFFARSFDGVVAWGLLFLLSPQVQKSVIRKVAEALHPGGKFLFTSPKEAVTWRDALTGRESVSLGSEMYRKILSAEGFTLDAEESDEGDNRYYLASKPEA